MKKARVLQEDAGFFLSGRSLQQRQGVADDQAVLVLVALVVARTGSRQAAAEGGVLPGEAQALEGAVRDHVGQGDIAFPLALVAAGGLDLVAAQVNGVEGQARHADGGPARCARRRAGICRSARR